MKNDTLPQLTADERARIRGEWLYSIQIGAYIPLSSAETGGERLTDRKKPRVRKRKPL